MQRLRNARRLGYKSRILVSPKVLTTKHHHRLAVKVSFRCTRRNNNSKKRSYLISVLISGLISTEFSIMRVGFTSAHGILS